MVHLVVFKVLYPHTVLPVLNVRRGQAKRVRGAYLLAVVHSLFCLGHPIDLGGPLASP